jgi:hypothetical protein
VQIGSDILFNNLSVLTNDAAALDTHCKLIAVLYSILYWFWYEYTMQYQCTVHTVLCAHFKRILLNPDVRQLCAVF